MVTYPISDIATRHAIQALQRELDKALKRIAALEAAARKGK